MVPIALLTDNANSSTFEKKNFLKNRTEVRQGERIGREGREDGNGERFSLNGLNS